jgi:hypothetical protein
MNWCDEGPEFDWEEEIIECDGPGPEDDPLGITDEEIQLLVHAGDHYRNAKCFTESECVLIRDLKVRGVQMQVIKTHTALSYSQIRDGFAKAPGNVAYEVDNLQESLRFQRALRDS